LDVRIVITADLHYNHPHSRPLADELIDRINRAGGDGEMLEACLSRFQFFGPKLFVAGNHELWTSGPDSYELFASVLPVRIRALGWHWLQDSPFVLDDLAIVGTVGWYDYSFAPSSLGIPRRFYEAKVSPGAAERFSEFAPLFNPDDDIPPHARQVVARWNDGRFVHLHRSDETFLDDLLAQLREQLESLRAARRVIAAVHHLPFAELLPPSRSAQWDFAKAYLGSAKIGKLLLEFSNVSDVFCGHSHFKSQATIMHIRAINIGSGYGSKTLKILDV
jgi:hypothetical protein